MPNPMCTVFPTITRYYYCDSLYSPLLCTLAVLCTLLVQGLGNRGSTVSVFSLSILSMRRSDNIIDIISTTIVSPGVSCALVLVVWSHYPHQPPPGLQDPPHHCSSSQVKSLQDISVSRRACTCTGFPSFFFAPGASLTQTSPPARVSLPTATWVTGLFSTSSARTPTLTSLDTSSST